jgi:hypothetical protein
VHEVDEVTAELAHRRQERVPRLEVQGLRIIRWRLSGQLAIGHDIPPILLAGVQQEEMEIDGLRQTREKVEIHGRHRRDTEE